MAENMNEERRIETEEVESVTPPPKARVQTAVEDGESAGEKLERKRDYLEGFLSQQPAAPQEGEPGGSTYDAIIDALKEIYDPEIPVNIYDLGLIYGVDINDNAVHIRMTLTAPTCGMGPVLISDVKYRVAKVPNVTSVEVELVFDPPWSRDMMTEEAQLEAGLFF